VDEVTEVCVVGTALNPVPTREKLNSLYWEKELSLSEVGKMYNRCPTTIRNWLKKQGIKTRPFNGRTSSLTRFDKNKWTKEGVYWRPKNCSAFYYILGVLKGDGSVSIFTRNNGRKTYRIRLDVRDKKFCLSFMDGLNKIGLRVPKLLRRKKRGSIKPQYMVQLENMRLALWYKSLQLDTIHEEINKKPIYKKEFIRGFYESEGTLVRRKSDGHLRLGMNNCDEDLIILVAKLLESLGFHPTITKYDNKRLGHNSWYNVRLHRQNEIKRFLSIIKPCIRNKIKGEDG